MGNLMQPAFPKGSKIIYTDDSNKEFKGTVLSAKRVKNTDFFTYMISLAAEKVQQKWVPSESPRMSRNLLLTIPSPDSAPEWRHIVPPDFKKGVSDYQLRLRYKGE